MWKNSRAWSPLQWGLHRDSRPDVLSKVCDCERGPWLVHGCWDGPVSLWLSFLLPDALSHPAQPQGEHAVYLLKAPCSDEGGGGLPLSCPVSAQESLLPFLYTQCVPGQAVLGVSRLVSDARLAWVWENHLCVKKQVHYLLRDSYALSSVGTPRAANYSNSVIFREAML